MQRSSDPEKEAEKVRAAFSASINKILPQTVRNLVIGFSGGPDSSALLDLCVREFSGSGISITAVYVHHGISVHAGEWEDFARQRAEELHVRFESCHVEVRKKQRTSLEAEARELRYGVLAPYVPDRSTALVTAHHLDDLAETVLLALKRGSGVRGLAAMGPVQDFSGGFIVRPLLSVTKSELLGYLNANGITFVTDESNFDTDYDRNFLRLRILPLLTERWGGFRESLKRTSEICAESSELLDEVAEEDLTGAVSPATGGLIIERLSTLSPVRRRNALRWFYFRKGNAAPSYSFLQAVFDEVALAGADRTPELRWEGGIAVRYMGELFNISGYPAARQDFTAGKDFEKRIALPDRTLVISDLRDRMPHGSVAARSPNPGEKVSVRFALPGSLVLQPSGRKHSRSLKKIWGEYSVPVWRRRYIPVVFYNDSPVMLAGICAMSGFEPAENDGGRLFSYFTEHA